MIEYIIKHNNPNNNHTANSFYRGCTKEEAEDNFKKDFPNYIILSIEIYNGYKTNK